MISIKEIAKSHNREAIVFRSREEFLWIKNTIISLGFNIREVEYTNFNCIYYVKIVEEFYFTLLSSVIKSNYTLHYIENLKEYQEEDNLLLLI